MWVILCLGLDNNVVYIKLTNPTGKRLKETPQIYAEERNKKDPFRLNPNFASLRTDSAVDVEQPSSFEEDAVKARVWSPSRVLLQWPGGPQVHHLFPNHGDSGQDTQTGSFFPAAIMLKNMIFCCCCLFVCFCLLCLAL